MFSFMRPITRQAYERRISMMQTAADVLEWRDRSRAQQVAALIAQRDKQAGELNQIKIALEEVAVYEGMVGISPVAYLVSELVRDHEELEARIDAVVSLLQGAKEAAEDEPSPLVDEVARLLQGGERVPDTIAGL